MMLSPRHRKRTASASLVSLVLHLLVALFLGVHFNWQLRNRVMLDETAIQVTLHAGELPPAPALAPRPALSASVSTPQPTSQPKVTRQQRRPSEVQQSSIIPTPAIAEVMPMTNRLGMAPQTQASLASQETSPFASSQKLLLSEEGSLPSASSDTSSDADGELSASETDEGEEIFPSRSEQMHAAIRGVASHIVGGNGSGHLDVVFLLDTSGSMYDNIIEVSNQLIYMTTMFEQHGLDYRIGLVKFKFAPSSLRIFPMTTDVTKFQRILQNTTKVGGPERAYDAIMTSLSQIGFREGVDKHFILITDEPLSGSYSPPEVWRRCVEAGVRVSVIGLKDPFHRKLVEVTGGTWQPIPISPD